MANNYCESSSKLKLTHEQLTTAIPIAEKVMAEIEKEGHLGVVVEYEDDGIWFHDEESIVPEQVVQIAQAVLDGLEIDEPFVFGWCFRCDKPRVDEFGGGACCVRRGKPAFWVDATSIALEHANKT